MNLFGAGGEVPVFSTFGQPAELEFVDLNGQLIVDR